MMNYIEIEFTCKRIQDWQQDLLINDLAEIGFDTFEDTDKGFNAFIPEPNFDFSSLETLLLQLPEEVDISYQVKNIAYQNWNKVWEENFQPLTIGEKCYVRATFHESKEKEYPIEIVVDPKMAFGTGHHQTTSLMMEYLLEEDLKGKRVLDMGCGTGILGILSLKRGAEFVVALDNDPVCCESTLENSKLNKVEDLSVLLGDSKVIPRHKFNLIIANINRNILLEQIPDYSSTLTTGGVLLLSGFYEGDDLEILKTKAESEGFQFLSHKVRDRWVAARFIRQ
jgi:ribosomal protein L11 methyltransferase